MFYKGNHVKKKVWFPIIDDPFTGMLGMRTDAHFFVRRDVWPRFRLKARLSSSVEERNQSLPPGRNEEGREPG